MLVSVSSTQAGVLWDEGTSTEETPVPDWPVGVWGQMFDVEDPAHCGRCHSGQVALDCLRKQQAAQITGGSQ